MTQLEMVLGLYDGKKTSLEIAQIVGFSPRYVRRIAQRYALSRLGPGAMRGERNHQFVSGRRIDLDGYVVVGAPEGHPFARIRLNHKAGILFEHRLVLEEKLGRYLLPTEVTDHIDGLTLHNEQSNLRLFDCNGDHLRATIKGTPKRISKSGRENIRIKHLPDVNFQPVDTYYLRRKRGDVRLLQILLAALSLGIDSPYLLGTHRYLEKAQGDYSSRSTIELALAELYQRWEADLAL